MHANENDCCPRHQQELLGARIKGLNNQICQGEVESDGALQSLCGRYAKISKLTSNGDVMRAEEKQYSTILRILIGICCMTDSPRLIRDVTQSRSQAQ